MGLAVKYEVEGLEPTVHKLRSIGEHAIEPEPVLLELADALRGIERDRFESEGPGWAPNAESTLEQKEGDKIGQETKAMMDSLTKKGAPGSLELVVGSTLHFGTTLVSEEDAFPYPVAFDQGRTDGSQPARPLFDIGPPEMAIFTKAVQAWLTGLDVAAGFNMGGDRIAGSDVMPRFG